MKDYLNRCHRMIRRWAQIREPDHKRRAKNKFLIKKKLNVSSFKIKKNKFYECTRSLPLFAKCDVLVIGGGPAGISAALAAQRAGAQTIIMERMGCFGGVITTVGMETIGWYRYEGCVESNGIGIEMERKAAELGGTIKWPYNNSECLDTEFFKIVSDDLILSSGVRPLLHAYAVDAITKNGKIIGVVFESKSGRQVIQAERVIDCTGDADIAYFCGTPYKKNHKDDMMGTSMIFSVSGVKKEKFLQHVSQSPKTYKDWGGDWQHSDVGKEAELKTPYIEVDLNKKNFRIEGTWSSITDNGEGKNLNLIYLKGYDGTCVEDLTKASMQGRKQCMDALDTLKSHIPGFDEVTLRNFGMTLGIRDTRKIIGKYNLTEKDVTNEARFKDSVGIFPEFVDGYNVLILPTTGRYFQVPYGCLVPENIDNLLVAGRCVAGDDVSHAAMRNMMACTVTGQAAGVAAAISLKCNQSIQEVDIKIIQQELINQGVRIE